MPTAGDNFEDSEKSSWLQEQQASRRRTRLICIILLALLILGAIAGGIAGGILAAKEHSKSSSSSTISGSHKSHGLYDSSSPEVKSLLQNPNLHKVFPGMDYTPLGAQYPECLTSPLDQNNITLDLAVLSQLTPTIRLYGTDCLQTEKVLTGISRLNLNSTLKVWAGVWLGNNKTTNDRQVNQLYTILDTYPQEHFAGIIVGNEVLFRKDLSPAALGEQMDNVRQKVKSKGWDLPIATSDLGDEWDAQLAGASDLVMANVHPFFAGVPADQAAAWTWSFWQQHDASLKSGGKSVIAETGWPSEGGTDCGTDNPSSPSPSSTAVGAVADIPSLNTFLSTWVCQSLTNGTQYFWFEAFDEPWKKIFDTPGKKWESKWGLFDEERNLKDGVKIPDCGGKEAGS
ncbi:glycoside hydrolase family 17 protein [Piedraia hortae CBS 480.64]|uniref:glucan endo-1,3-beta-D-glucosidase n=1 Tax=Piedraia hortae CBS 480.64 TaxID=1314780 RepID=A0A6A7C3Q3_9PEZI|nr:glycoside hydrolase family 17 protein [Piedraia hortae CBS 480.64]